MPTPVPTLDLLRRPQISPRARAVSRALRNPLLLEGTQAPEKISTTNLRCTLVVVIHTAVDEGRPKNPLKPSSVGGLGIEDEARCGRAK